MCGRIKLTVFICRIFLAKKTSGTGVRLRLHRMVPSRSKLSLSQNIVVMIVGIKDGYRSARRREFTLLQIIADTFTLAFQKEARRTFKLISDYNNKRVF